MMTFDAKIKIMPRKELLDPQGKTVTKSLPNVGVQNVSHVRIGKHIELRVDANNVEEANAIVETACKNLLANVIMETYEFELIEA